MSNKLIIPAAGLGSRLGSDRPKALTQLNKKPLIEYVITAATGIFDEIVLVVGPNQLSAFKNWENNTDLHNLNVRYAIQNEPSGSFDAVVCGIEAIRDLLGSSGNVVVVWADQVGVSASTLNNVQQSLDSGNEFVIPLMLVENPYVWIEFSSSSQITNIYRQRDGDSPPEVAHSDLGVFGFSDQIALQLISNKDKIFPEDLGGKERDFTYALPEISKYSNSTNIYEIFDKNQLAAVNTVDDLEEASQIMKEIHD